jgi:glycine oxidase
MSSNSDFIVIGGGVIGLLSARQLAMAGHSVVLLERNPQTGLESSWAGGGILSPLYPWRYDVAVTRLAAIGHAGYPQVAAQLLADTGVDPEYVRSGHLILDLDEEPAARAWLPGFHAASVASGSDAPLTLNRLDRQAIDSVEPGLAGNYMQALWFAEIAQLRNPCLVRSLLADVIRRGVSIVTECEVHEFRQHFGRVSSVVTSNGEFQADRYLLATGAWSGKLLSGTGLSIPVEPVRGQMILFRGEPDVVRTIVMRSGRYLVPRRDGHVLAGSTLERVGFDKSTTRAAHDELYREAVAMIPALAGLPVVKQWSGLRPGSPDGVPFIGHHPGLDNLVVCAGHYRNGIIIGLGSVQLAVDLLIGNVPCIDPEPYRLGGSG